MIFSKKALVFILLFSLVFVSLSVSGQALSYRQGEVLVKVPVGVTTPKLHKFINKAIASDTPYKLEQVTDVPLNIWKVTVDYKKVSEIKLMKQLEQESFFEVCQHNHIIKKRVIPNDPEFDKLYHYINTGQDSGILDADYDAEEAWDLTTGGSTINGDEIVVAVIDDGLDGDHEDLMENIWINEAEIRDNGQDDDGNGYVDDYFGWDTDRDNPDIFDEGGHAVPLYGIIGAKGNNGKGVVGVNWDVKMMVVQGGGDQASTLAAYSYPYKFRKLYNETNGEQGAFVVATNSSFGIDKLFPEDAPLWCEYFDILGSVGILSCGATSNENFNVDEVGDIPSTCTSEYFIGVTNLNNRSEKVFQAGFGKKSIDLGAFGEDIYTTAIGNKYKTSSGTSEATPFVTGLIALMYSLDCPLLADLSLSNPTAAAQLVKNALLTSVEDVPSLKELTVTGGRMNMNNSITLLANICDDCGTIINNEVSNRTDTQVDISWEAGNGNTGTNLRYRLAGTTAWSTNNNVSSPYTIQGLSGCNSYEFQLQSICGSTSDDWGPLFKFESEGCCVLPMTFDYNIIGSTAEFTWNSIFAAQQYLIEYRPVSQAAWTKEFVTDNKFTLVFTENCLAYVARLKVVCSGEETLYSEELIVKNECGACSSDEYCNIVNIDNTFEWIDSVYFAGDAFKSGMDETPFADNTSVKNFKVIHGQNTEIKVVPRFQSSSAEENFVVYIDWNQNFRFDEDEKILGATSNSAVSADITVPSGAKLGPTRMRVIMAFARTPSGCGATGFRFGEVEDYCVFVEAEPGECDIDSDLTANMIKRNAATLRWELDNNIISFAVRYKKASANNWIELSEIADSLRITDLQKCTDYEAQIKNICGIDTSRYSASLFFRTKCTDNTFEIDPSFAKVNPNPFNLMITIKLVEALPSGQIELINNQGQIIRSRAISKTTLNYNLDTSDLMNGIYFVRIQSGKKIAFKKLVKID